MNPPATRGRIRWILAVLALVAPAFAGVAVAEDEAENAARQAALLKQVTEARRAANANGTEVQKRIDALSDETDELVAKHNAAAAQLAALRTYNERMREIVDGQEEELAGLRGQLDQVDEVGRSVTPLMLRMIAALESFVELDLPFLQEERQQRLEDLRRLMIRAEVPVSEKYRLIMEAYQTEADYGRTIEAYRAPLAPAGSGETVDFLRFGRVALVYLSLDEGEAGVWDNRTRSWQPLDSSWHDEVLLGMRVARKQIAPDLIPIPLPAPTTGGAGG